MRWFDHVLSGVGFLHDMVLPWDLTMASVPISMSTTQVALGRINRSQWNWSTEGVRRQKKKVGWNTTDSPWSEQSKPPAKLTGTAVRLSGLVGCHTPPSDGRASWSVYNVAMYLHGHGWPGLRRRGEGGGVQQGEAEGRVGESVAGSGDDGHEPAGACACA